MFLDLLTEFSVDGGLTITRRGAQTFTNGLANARTDTTFAADPIVVFPSNGRGLRFAEFAAIKEGEWGVFTEVELQTRDTFVYQGVTYEVQEARYWEVAELWAASAKALEGDAA